MFHWTEFILSYYANAILNERKFSQQMQFSFEVCLPQLIIDSSLNNFHGKVRLDLWDFWFIKKVHSCVAWSSVKMRRTLQIYWKTPVQ